VLAPINIAFLTLSPGLLKGGGTVTATIKLQALSNAGAIVVVIASDQPGLATPSTSRLTIPAGALTATFTLATAKVSALTTVNISVTAHGATLTQPLQLSP